MYTNRFFMFGIWYLVNKMQDNLKRLVWGPVGTVTEANDLKTAF